MASSIVYNCDCMEILRASPDGAFDLAVVDPPYGDAGGVTLTGSEGGSTVTRTGGSWSKKYGKKS